MTVPGMPAGARPAGLFSHYECPVAVPYRLDLTVSVLRRLSTNVVDVLTPGGQFASLRCGRRPLSVTLEGDESAPVLGL
jgi:hypothetical protein